MQFTINKNSTLPFLDIEPIINGRDTYEDLFYLVQSADITFSMTNVNTGIKKIANAPCEIIEIPDEECTNKFVIRYKWNKRDTNEAGSYIGNFKIKFNDNTLTLNNKPIAGDLIVPISEDLNILIQNNTFNK